MSSVKSASLCPLSAFLGAFGSSESRDSDINNTPLCHEHCLSARQISLLLTGDALDLPSSWHFILMQQMSILQTALSRAGFTLHFTHESLRRRTENRRRELTKYPASSILAAKRVLYTAMDLMRS